MSRRKSEREHVVSMRHKRKINASQSDKSEKIPKLNRIRIGRTFADNNWRQ